MSSGSIGRRSLYNRTPQTPKTRQSIRDVVLSPIPRRILEAVPYKEGYVFSKDGDGKTPLGMGTWIKAQWKKAQIEVGIKRPVRWHDLRHQFVSFLIHIGKNAKYISSQAGHASAGFTFDRYGHLLEAVSPAGVEWPEDLLWPDTCPQPVIRTDRNEQQRAVERKSEKSPEALLNKGHQR